MTLRRFHIETGPYGASCEGPTGKWALAEEALRLADSEREQFRSKVIRAMKELSLGEGVETWLKLDRVLEVIGDL